MWSQQHRSVDVRECRRPELRPVGVTSMPRSAKPGKLHVHAAVSHDANAPPATSSVPARTRCSSVGAVPATRDTRGESFTICPRAMRRWRA
jgi:hypothetical protein